MTYKLGTFEVVSVGTAQNQSLRKFIILLGTKEPKNYLPFIINVKDEVVLSKAGESGRCCSYQYVPLGVAARGEG